MALQYHEGSRKDAIAEQWPEDIYTNAAFSNPESDVFFSFMFLTLVKGTAQVLLQKVPNTIDLPSLEKELMGVKGVEEIHELHVWQLNLTKSIASLHVILKPVTNFLKVSVNVRARS